MSSWNKIASIDKICPQCQCHFLAKPLKHHFKKFCSHSCYAKSRIGKSISEETKMKISLSNIETYRRPEIRNKISKALTGNKNTLGKKRPSFSPAWKLKISQSISKLISEGLINGGRGRKCWYISTKTGVREFCHSTYELRRMKHLDIDASVKSWSKGHGIRIPYNNKNYIPDFLITLNDERVFIEEVKGWVKSKEMFEAKNSAAKVYCKARGWQYRIVYEKDLETLF